MNLINSVNPKLRKYIEESIFPLYDLNGPSHGIKHIKEVIERSFQIIEEYEKNEKNEKNPVKINYDLAYIIAAYHDIGDHIDRKKHHIISGEIMFEDNNLDEFISPKEKITAREAIEDHRASNKNLPRSIYGRIVLTADRKDIIFRDLEYSLLFKKMVPILKNIEDIDVIGIFLIDDNKVFGEFKANADIDISKLAIQLGGGGHKKSAGFTSTLPLEKVLEISKDYIKKYI